MVRERALTALELLIPQQKRVDPVITELLGTIATVSADLAVQGAHIRALGAVLAGAGQFATPAKKQEVIDKLAGGLLSQEDDDCREVRDWP